MDIKVSRKFSRKWNQFVDQTLDDYGSRQVIKNTKRLEFLMRVLVENPKYGFPEKLLDGICNREYRSLLLIGPYKILYYTTRTTIHIEDLWNMRMSPARLTKPYNLQK